MGSLIATAIPSVILCQAVYKDVPSGSDTPALLVMAAIFLCLGLFAIMRPEALRTAMDRLANTWEQDGWHPYKMPVPAIRIVLGGVGILGSALFVYIACFALGR